MYPFFIALPTFLEQSYPNLLFSSSLSHTDYKSCLQLNSAFIDNFPVKSYIRWGNNGSHRDNRQGPRTNFPGSDSNRADPSHHIPIHAAGGHGVQTPGHRFHPGRSRPEEAVAGSHPVPDDHLQPVWDRSGPSGLVARIPREKYANLLNHCVFCNE